MDNIKKEVFVSKEGVFDRIEQSFKLFKDNFLGLFLPLFLYFGGLTITIVYFTNYLLNIFKEFINNTKYGELFNRINELSKKPDLANNGDFINGLKNNELVKSFPDLLINNIPEILFYIFFYIGILIIIKLLFIPFLLATIKGIKEAYLGKVVDFKENMIYGVNNILSSFKTYWYLFTYILLIPALILIVGLLFILYGIQDIGAGIVFISFLTYIIFVTYRGIKASFHMSSAIDKNKFTKENFKFSVKITNNKWWRVLGNFLLIGLIIYFGTGITNSILSGILGSSFGNEISYDEKMNIKDSINLIIDSYSIIHDIISSLIFNIIKTVTGVFILIFTYIFFKRLEIEDNALENNLEKNEEINNNKIIENKTIEL